MKKSVVVQTDEEGQAGKDIDGNLWTPFTHQENDSAMCATCGTWIADGYLCGRHGGLRFYYCRQHVQWVIPAEDRIETRESTQPYNTQLIAPRAFDQGR